MKSLGMYITGKKKTMMTEKMTYRWLWSCLIAGSLLLTGCSDRYEEEPQPLPVPQPEEGDMLELRAITRTDGAYQISTAAQTIPVYLATIDKTSETAGTYSVVEGLFQSDASGNWESSLSVKEETLYYMYGYMPGTISATQLAPDGKSNGDYSKGIDLTLNNLPAITTDDISVLVGVQRVGAQPITDPPSDPPAPAVTEGQYGFRSGIKGHNFVNLLMAHLYARLQLGFKIDPDYAELRSIHLKTVTLTSKYGDAASVTVNLRDGKGIGNPTFPKGTEGETAQTVTLFESSSTVPEKVLDKSLGNTALALDIPAHCRPIAVEEGKFYNLTLTTTYDVWDRAYDSTKGKVVDKNNLGTRTSVNKVKLNIAALKPGNERTLVLTVNPTYLYILSDNDLDNPTIHITVN